MQEKESKKLTCPECGSEQVEFVAIGRSDVSYNEYLYKDLTVEFYHRKSCGKKLINVPFQYARRKEAD